MTVFEQVTVTREANIYFNGQVTSRTVSFANGAVKTLGIMLPGQYTFSTAKAELMEILSGALRYRLQGESQWQTVEGGQSFEVPADVTFEVDVQAITDYCCSYLD